MGIATKSRDKKRNAWRIRRNANKAARADLNREMGNTDSFGTSQTRSPAWHARLKAIANGLA